MNSIQNSVSSSGDDNAATDAVDIEVTTTANVLYTISSSWYLIFMGIVLFSLTVNLIQELSIRKINKTRENKMPSRITSIGVQLTALFTYLFRFLSAALRCIYGFQNKDVFDEQGILVSVLIVVPYALVVVMMTILVDQWFQFELYNSKNHMRRIVRIIIGVLDSIVGLMFLLSIVFILVGSDEYTIPMTYVFFVTLTLVTLTGLIVFIVGVFRLVFLIRKSAIGSQSQSRAMTRLIGFSVGFSALMFLRIIFYFSTAANDVPWLRFIGYAIETAAVFLPVLLHFKSHSVTWTGKEKGISEGIKETNREAGKGVDDNDYDKNDYDKEVIESEMKNHSEIKDS
eukprot:gb/GECH01014045.1/.p1 GENE.gb/GECH01014045.1/~~gb/GECH01014045.1/.p1  ORF type:complete len:342 (+),score=74.79 gb/GECH01014045.1/:1-1026(+)